jgi:hypothetical protein
VIETAKKNNLNPRYFLRLIQCESSWQEDALGDSETSFGVLQFKKDTFALFSNKFNFQNFNIDNSYHQVDLAAKMIKEGYILHWKNCARKIGWTKL